MSIVCKSYRKMNISRIVFVCFALFVTSCQPQADKGKLKSEEVNPDGSVLRRTFKPNGKLFAEIHKKDGKKNGVTKNFYDNGKVQVETNFVNDKKEGDSKFYYEDGKICQHVIYKNDVKNGIEKHYYKNGKLACEIPYLDGEVQPGLKEYSSEGVLIRNSPTIVVTPINKMVTENKYILRLSLSNQSHAVSFARIYSGEEKKSKLAIQAQNGIGDLTFVVSPGKGYREQVILEASFETAYGNPYVTRTTYNLSIVNR
jgi:hypothetical protein